ncbi:MAG: methyltransferase domain-containing protein [Polyangia bacterium]
MNKNDPAAGPPSTASRGTVEARKAAGSLPEASQGHDPTLKWCIPDSLGNRESAAPSVVQVPGRVPAIREENAVTPKAPSLAAPLVEGAIKGALPQTILESPADKSSTQGESIEIIVADGPTGAGQTEPLGAPDDAVTPPPRIPMEPVTPPPPRREMEAVTPPPRVPMEPVTPPPPRREMEAVTPPPRVPMGAVTLPPRAPMDEVTPPPRVPMEPVTPPPPRREMEAVTPVPEPVNPARPVPEVAVVAAPIGGASPPAVQASAPTGALPEAPIRLVESGEVKDGEFEVMEPGDTPSTPLAAASTPPPVPAITGVLPTTSAQSPRPEPSSETSGSVSSARAEDLASEELPLPEALSRRPLKKRLKPWFEEVFDENYLRTLPFMTAEQTLRETAFLKEALSPPAEGAVLDVGCGYGRHAIELSQRGFKVTGLDLSLPLLIRAADEAQRRGLSVNFVHADMREMTYDSQFDAAYCVLTSFGYFDEETNLRVASSICRALKPGGRFLVDTINRDYIVSDLPSRVWWEGDGCVVLEEVDFDFHTSRVVVRRSIVFGDGRQLENEISIRAYSLHELGRVLRRAGFQVLEVAGSLESKAPFLGAASRHVVLVCERSLT